MGAQTIRIEAAPEALPDYPLDPATDQGRWFLTRGMRDYRDAARYVQELPYGRNSDRSDYRLVLGEGRGTCSTKHALLAGLAEGHVPPVQLRLGVYEMDGQNTPGVGPVLRRHGLVCVPEAHCYLAYRGARVDLTRSGVAGQSLRLLHEERISPHQIGAYKVERHRGFVREWATARGPSFERVWRVREDCIRALAEGKMAASQEEVEMPQEIEDGDWVRFPEGGSQVEGKVIEAEVSTYHVGLKNGGYTIVAVDDRVEKIDPPEGEE